MILSDKFRVFTNIDDEKRLLTALIQAKGDGIRILEAGCGRKWPLDIKTNYHLTGIDLDAAALTARMYNIGDLDEAIIGDLKSCDIPPNSFDVIYCSHVLEHVNGAEQVIDNFIHWLRPGGLILIQIPVSNSVYGFITKITPYWVHVFYYRYLLGKKNAGTPGYGPYKTFYDSLISEKGMRRYCEDRGLFVIDQYGQFYWMRGWQKTVINTIGLLSMGRLSSRYNNVGYVITKS